MGHLRRLGARLRGKAPRSKEPRRPREAPLRVGGHHRDLRYLDDATGQIEHNLVPRLLEPRPETLRDQEAPRASSAEPGQTSTASNGACSFPSLWHHRQLPRTLQQIGGGRPASQQQSCRPASRSGASDQRSPLHHTHGEVRLIDR